MNNLFIGMLLLFLNFNINIESISIGLFPDFLGYIYIMKGVKELSNESSFFLKVNPFARNMTYFTFVLYIFNLIGLKIGYVMTILGLISTLFGLYVAYLCIKGIRDMEVLNGWDLQGESLFKTWQVLAVFSIISSTIAFIAGIGAILIIIGNIILIIVYLVSFNHTKKLYLDITNNRM